MHARVARGSTLVWAACVMVVMIGIVSLGVDFGRVQSARGELQTVADVAGRAAAASMNSGQWTAMTSAQTIASQNVVDGTSQTLTQDDIEFGVWNGSSFATLSPGASFNNANAVRVTARRNTQRGNAVPLMFGQLLGIGSPDLASRAIVLKSGQSLDTTVDGVMNLWFAGQSSTAVARWSGDTSYASQSAPRLVTGTTIIPGTSLEFTATGPLSNVPWTYGNTPDGDGWICNNWTDNLGGMANCMLPINALMGVFLTDAVPDPGQAPSPLDFSTQASRDYESLSPQIAQPFFIGDGRTSAGVQQRVVVPPGATRLYLGSMDPYGWWNNAGTARVNIRTANASIVVR